MPRYLVGFVALWWLVFACADGAGAPKDISLPVDMSEVADLGFVGTVTDVDANDWVAESAESSESGKDAILSGPGSFTLVDGTVVVVPARTAGWDLCSHSGRDTIGAGFCRAFGGFDEETGELGWFVLVEAERRTVGELVGFVGRNAAVDLFGGPLIELGFAADAVYGACDPTDTALPILLTTGEMAPIPERIIYPVNVDEEGLVTDVECVLLG